MLIHAGDNTISKPQSPGPSLFFCTLASRTLTLGLMLSERIVYVQFVRLLIYPSIASNGNKEKMDT